VVARLHHRKRLQYSTVFASLTWHSASFATVSRTYPTCATFTRIFGVLIFEIWIDRAGSVADVRLAKAVDQQPPWPTLAQRWLKAISDWRYEPPTLHHKPVAVCLTVTVRVEVR